LVEFNWIGVTWSSGWSVKDEEQNRENLKKVIARCHENGIHVTAYLSASNMFATSADRDDPETKQYGLWMHGLPYYYVHRTQHWLHIAWKRRLTDTRKPGWRAYLVKKAELAAAARLAELRYVRSPGHSSAVAVQRSLVQLRMVRVPGRGTSRYLQCHRHHP
jgi:hypothetical protein